MQLTNEESKIARLSLEKYRYSKEDRVKIGPKVINKYFEDMINRLPIVEDITRRLMILVLDSYIHKREHIGKAVDDAKHLIKRIENDWFHNSCSLREIPELYRVQDQDISVQIDVTLNELNILFFALLKSLSDSQFEMNKIKEKKTKQKFQKKSNAQRQM